MTHSALRRFPARSAALAEILHFVEECCGVANVSIHDCMRLLLMAEELFTNSIHHGYRRECDDLVSVGIEVGEGAATLSFEDGAPAFDPFAGAATPPAAAPAEQRPVGGLGITLMRTIASEARYERRGERNRITLVLPLTRR